jgi:hypothetical protein
LQGTLVFVDGYGFTPGDKRNWTEASIRLRWGF